MTQQSRVVFIGATVVNACAHLTSDLFRLEVLFGTRVGACE